MSTVNLFIAIVILNVSVLPVCRNEELTCAKDSAMCETADQVLSCVHFNPSTFSSTNASIMYINTLGRLGNHMVSYGVLLTLRKLLDVEIYITQETQEVISRYFKIPNLPVLQERFCNPDDIKFDLYDDTVEELLANKDYHRGKLINLWQFGYLVIRVHALALERDFNINYVK